MKIFVKVKANAKEDKVEKGHNYFKVSIKERPIKGKANKQVIKTLANYFNVSKSKIEIVSGLKSKEKILKINK